LRKFDIKETNTSFLFWHWHPFWSRSCCIKENHGNNETSAFLLFLDCNKWTWFHRHTKNISLHLLIQNIVFCQGLRAFNVLVPLMKFHKKSLRGFYLIKINDFTYKIKLSVSSWRHYLQKKRQFQSWQNESLFLADKTMVKRSHTYDF